VSGRDWLRSACGYLIALAGLLWVLHDLRLPDLRAAALSLSWGWVLPAIGCDIASYLAQGCRWSLLLRPQGHLGCRRATAAVYAGLFVNELLPMRPGEVLRAYLVSRRLQVEWPHVLPSMLVERLLDSLWVALALALVAALVPLPPRLVHAGELLGILVLLAVLLFLYLLRPRAGETREPPPEDSSGIGARWRRFLHHQRSGLRAIGLSRRLLGAALLTAALLVLQGLAFYLVLLACRVRIDLWAALAVFLIVHFGTALPNAPGNVGSYQFFCVLGLQLFGVDKTLATGFSIVVFILLTLPLIGLGLLAMARSGLSVRSLREDVRRISART